MFCVYATVLITSTGSRAYFEHYEIMEMRTQQENLCYYGVRPYKYIVQNFVCLKKNVRM